MVGSLALFVNTILGMKGLTGTNTLAYTACSKVTKENV
jgi:hypothetical protein